jgi:hypothetical protein
MDDETRALLTESNALLRKIADNTKPVGKVRRVVDGAVALVTIGGAVATIDQIVKWIGLLP